MIGPKFGKGKSACIEFTYKKWPSGLKPRPAVPKPISLNTSTEPEASAVEFGLGVILVEDRAEAPARILCSEEPGIQFPLVSKARLAAEAL